MTPDRYKETTYFYGQGEVVRRDSHQIVSLLLPPGEDFIERIGEAGDESAWISIDSLESKQIGSIDVLWPVYRS